LRKSRCRGGSDTGRHCYLVKGLLDGLGEVHQRTQGLPYEGQELGDDLWDSTVDKRVNDGGRVAYTLNISERETEF
jgi:hypothetical protein